MNVRIVDGGWPTVFAESLEMGGQTLRIVSPFIKTGALHSILSSGHTSVRVITRFNLADCASGVSDVSALRILLDAGAKIRGVKNLHAKLYIFGATRAIVTSANLTNAALVSNHELGMVCDDALIVQRCLSYFDDLWARAGVDLRSDQVEAWDEIVAEYLMRGGGPSVCSDLLDHGADAGIIPAYPPNSPGYFADPPQALVKFAGRSNDRSSLSTRTIEEIEGTGSHWAVCYPTTRRPRNVENGAVVFVGRFTRDPDDIVIYGRAIAMKHVPIRDEATPKDIERRRWKQDWSNYIRVHHAEFVAGSLANGVSLNVLMDALGSDSFASTKRNAKLREGNTNPRRSYSQQSAVVLSAEGFSWLGERFQTALDTYGKIPENRLAALDSPDPPGGYGARPQQVQNPTELRDAVKLVIDQNESVGYPPTRFRRMILDGKPARRRRDHRRRP